MRRIKQPSLLVKWKQQLLDALGLVPKEQFNRAVTDTYNQFRVAYNNARNKQQKRRLIDNCEREVTELTTNLLIMSRAWLLPWVPERLFIRKVNQGIWFHVYSDRYKDKCHNTVMHEKDSFLRQIRFKLKGTENL